MSSMSDWKVGQHIVSQAARPKRAAAQCPRSEGHEVLGGHTHQRGVAEVLREQGSGRIVHCEIGASTGRRMS